MKIFPRELIQNLCKIIFFIQWACIAPLPNSGILTSIYLPKPQEHPVQGRITIFPGESVGFSVVRGRNYRTAQPLEYYKKFIESDVRPDERTLEEFRPTVLNIGCIGTADGSALVKLGNTTVMCGIKAEIASPKTEEPKKGYIVPNVELGPLCSVMFRPGPPCDEAQRLSHFLNEVMMHSGCINSEDLCIVPGKYVWVLYCDLVCLNYDGNITDACVLALMAALKNTSLPEVVWNEEQEKLETNVKTFSQLNIQCEPVSSTFSIFDDHILLVDPTVEEESLSTGEVTIVTTGDQICMVRKPGGSPMTPQQLDLCIDRSFARSIEVVRLVHETINSVDR